MKTKLQATNRLPLLGREVEAIISISLLYFVRAGSSLFSFYFIHLYTFAVVLKFGLKEHEIPQQRQAGTRCALFFMNRDQEEYVFKAFKNLYSDFPVGECIRDEQPDYIVRGVDTTIGVEITQIFVDNHINSSFNEKRKESLQSMLGDNLCERLEAIVPFKFVLSIDFSKKGFSKNEIPSIVDVCETYVKQLQFPLQDFTSVDIENWGQLPDEIDNINLFKFPSLEKSYFSEGGGCVLPDLTEKNLQVVLSKKDKALKQYKPCSEHWLVIEEGTFMSDSFGDIAVERFDTDFHKIFLYRHSKGQVVRLK